MHWFERCGHVSDFVHLVRCGCGASSQRKACNNAAACLGYSNIGK